MAPRTPAPVEKVELSDKHIPLRIAATIFFMVVGASALAYAISNFFTGTKGWREIGTLESDGITCAQDFSFMYNVGSDRSVSAENRELTEIYSHATKRAYELFNTSEIEGVVNIATINASPNTDITVDAVLYEAFEKILKSGDRTVFLGPVYEIYNGLFRIEFKEAAVDYDPRLNSDLAKIFERLCGYASDSSSVDIVLLEDGKVRLFVSQEYESFLESNELTNILDFSWMKNAFIIDYLAKEISSAGYKNGAISSNDGFSVNLGGEDTSFTVFHMCKDGVYPIGVMNYSGTRSIVYLRDYLLSETDSERYFVLENGEIRTPYIDISDGLCRSSTRDMTAYSDDFSCADIVLRISRLYISREFDESLVDLIRSSGIQLIYGDDSKVYYTDSQSPFGELFKESSHIRVEKAK